MTRLLLPAVLLLALALPAMAQTEGFDPPDPATPVTVQSAPPTKLDALDRVTGLVVKGLTSVGTIADDRGGQLEVFAVTADDKTHNTAARGIAVVITQKDGTISRSYVDEDEIDGLIDATKSLATFDRGATSMKDSRATFRTKGNLAVSNIDDNGGRFAIVRTLYISPVTGQATWASARFRANRLTELARQLQAAKDALGAAK